MPVHFLTRLERACETSQSLVCVGLDPDPREMPVTDPLEFNKAIVDSTADLVCAYKPNIAFYEALGLPGLRALAKTLEYIRKVAPQVVIIGDTKRGDVGHSAEAYARAMFVSWQFDAVTINAWGGLDSVVPFLDYAEHGVFIWCRGSNPDSAELQDLAVETPLGRQPLYQHLARSALKWNLKDNLGLVVGATSSNHLEVVRSICPGMPLLIPGVGAQRGSIEEAVRLGTDHRGRLAVINSSRGIIYASSGPDFAYAARGAASQLRQLINQILTDNGKGWT